ncbi:hypothetical protein BHM03_00029885 [Ensete ventricosum]|nr:hypothetical protein BHM03_00029885 [Ensete ventricosum]
MYVHKPKDTDKHEHSIKHLVYILTVTARKRFDATQILATITMHIVIVMTIIMVPKAGGFKKTGVSRIRSKSYCSVLHENLGLTQKPFLFLTKVDLLDFPDPQEACNTSRKTSPFSLGNSSSLLLHHRENHTARSHGF